MKAQSGFYVYVCDEHPTWCSKTQIRNKNQDTLVHQLPFYYPVFNAVQEAVDATVEQRPTDLHKGAYTLDW